MSSASNYRRQMNSMRSLAQKAYEHGIRINEMAKCSRPHPELIYLNDSKKIYLPRATIVHRCSNLYGCCPHSTHSCEPFKMEKISLYFFAIGIPQTSASTLISMRRNRNIEQLTFLNHTECICKPIDPTMWSSASSSSSPTSSIESNSIDDSPITNLDNSPLGSSMDQNNQSQQVRNIRDHSLNNTIIDYYPFIQKRINSNNQNTNSNQPVAPTSIIHARQNNNHNQPTVGNSQNQYDEQTVMYNEMENILRYWAKIMGYSAIDSTNSNKKIPKKFKNRNPISSKKRTDKRNVTKTSPPSSPASKRTFFDRHPMSTSVVEFRTPDTYYQYHTIHTDINNNNNNHNYDPSYDHYYSYYDNYHHIHPQQPQQMINIS